MADRQKAIVIGSGFGGAVAACRLSQAGLDVAVIERGRRYPRGSFPRDQSTTKDWMWALDGGLIDARPLSEVLVVQCAGYGGGSLIYANVAFRPPADLFEQGWPAGYSRDALDPYFDLAAYMLDISPVSEDRLPPKAALMRDVAARLGRSEQFFFPNLAIGFGETGKLKENRFGVPQSGCTYCGECDIGCNEHAKNTLDLNYLALAEKAGATVHVETEVKGISKVGDDYVVHVHDRVAGEDRTLTAPYVFVCTGAVNSTELLLRCRDHDKTLPALSEALGTGYSANGDFLSFAFDLEPPVFEPTVGPSITTGIIYDD
jgi:cholesterol oxidase